MKKALALLLTLSLLSTLFCGCSTQPEPEKKLRNIVLVPLDSRPCNTQYPLLLTDAAGATLSMPDADMLDHFLTPSDPDTLFDWLKENRDADEIILFANSLLNGGLIASREAAAYSDVNDRLEKLRAFCKSAGDARITVVQVLPRLIPSQFDDVLAPYTDELTDYGIAWDGADAAGDDAPVLADVPAEVVANYTGLQSKSADEALALNDMADSGLIDRLIVTADDSAVHCPANITFRALQEVKSKSTVLTHGADELTMLLMADSVSNSADATPVQVIWSDEAAADTVYPYESQTVRTTLSEKMALAGLTETPQAAHTLYIHASNEDAETTRAAINGNEGFLAIADIAQTNRGDEALTDVLLSPETADKVTAYAGWNTAANSIGTVCAVIRISALLDDADLSEADRERAFRALEYFRAIRLGEDQLWMTELAPDLHRNLVAQGFADIYTVFTDEAAAKSARASLDEAWPPFETRLAACFNGTHTLSLGKNSLAGKISDFSATPSFPWDRAFEIRLNIKFDLYS